MLFFDLEEQIYAKHMLKYPGSDFFYENSDSAV